MKYRYLAISDRKEEKRGILEAEKPDAGCCDDPGKRGSDPGTGAGT